MKIAPVTLRAVLAVVLAFSLCAPPSGARAVPALINFQSGFYSSEGDGIGNVYREKGITFRTFGTTGAQFHFDSSPQFQALEPMPETVPFLGWHNGGSNEGPNPVELHFGGSPFSLISLFLVDLFDPAEPSVEEPAMTITASNGSVMEVATGQLGTLMFGPGFQGIVAVRFDLDLSPQFDDIERAIDNVALNLSAVPAPATLPLLVLGLLALFGYGTRSRRALGI